MGDIFNILTQHGLAYFDRAGNLSVELDYSRGVVELEGRPQPGGSEGLAFLRDLLGTLDDSTQISIAGYNGLSFKSPSAGLVHLLGDDHIVMHRRDAGARVHPGFHSIGSGHPQKTPDEGFAGEIYTEEGLLDCAVREGFEETLFITRENYTEGKPYLIVPRGFERYVRETAAKVGLSGLKERFVDVTEIEGKDTLHVMTGRPENPYFALKTYLSLMFEIPNLNIMRVFKYDIDPEEVYPIDCEGMRDGNSFMRFDRETYIVPLDAIPRFGQPLTQCDVYRASVSNGVVTLWDVREGEQGEDGKYFGPEHTRVDHPHLFAPDDLLPRVLTALGRGVCAGASSFDNVGWLRLQIEKEQALQRNDWNAQAGMYDLLANRK